MGSSTNVADGFYMKIPLAEAQKLSECIAAVLFGVWFSCAAGRKIVYSLTTGICAENKTVK